MKNEQSLQIDRMVDGELDRGQQRALLLRCQERNQWRDLALAYVESQVWRGDLKTYVEQVTARPQFSVQRKDKESVARWKLLTLAAAIMLALGLGYGLGMRWEDSGISPNLAEFSPTRIPYQERENSSMQFMLANPATNELQAIKLPVVNASDLGPGWQRQLRTQIPEDLLAEMRERGINMQQTRTITPVRLSDGKRVLVPIDYYVEQLYQ